MAKIISRPSALRQEYIGLIKRIKRALLFAAFFVITATIGSIIMNTERLFSLGIILLGISIVGFILSIIFAALRHTDATVIKAGIEGENATADIIATLPDGYFGFLNTVVTCDGKKSELDAVVVGPSGIFIIETKNRKGYIRGSHTADKWTQIKIGRGGSEYVNEFYSPVKQVGTHIFRLAHFLRRNGVPVHISGIVYFSGADKVELSGKEGGIPVITNEKQLKKYILKGNEDLKPTLISKICSLLSQ